MSHPENDKLFDAAGDLISSNITVGEAQLLNKLAKENDLDGLAYEVSNLQQKYQVRVNTINPVEYCRHQDCTHLDDEE